MKPPEMPGYKHLPAAVTDWERGKDVGTNIDLEEEDSVWIPGKAVRGCTALMQKDTASFREDFPLP